MPILFEVAIVLLRSLPPDFYITNDDYTTKLSIQGWPEVQKT